MNPYWKLLVVDDDYDGENAQKIEQPNWTKKQLNVKSFGISQGWCYRVSWLCVKLWEVYNSMACTKLADQNVYTSKQLFLLPPPPPPPLHKDSIFNSKKNSSWSQLSDPSDFPPPTPPTKFMPLSDPGHHLIPRTSSKNVHWSQTPIFLLPKI
jgi:hypothetical protein